MKTTWDNNRLQIKFNGFIQTRVFSYHITPLNLFVPKLSTFRTLFQQRICNTRNYNDSSSMTSKSNVTFYCIQCNQLNKQYDCVITSINGITNQLNWKPIKIISEWHKELLYIVNFSHNALNRNTLKCESLMEKVSFE